MLCKIVVAAAIAAFLADPGNEAADAKIGQSPVKHATAQPQATAANAPTSAEATKQSSADVQHFEEKQAETKPGDPKLKGLHEIEKNVIEKTNVERARYGLPPLMIDRNLIQSARTHAAWMTNNHSLQHTSLPVAENIAMGQRSSDEAVSSWMGSSGHRANILNSGHRRIGVAAYRTPDGTIFWCQQFLP
ncbi:MAG: hypothetical protein IT427_00445 [Pirellulales bacterium]|nr:hypothetical protein [Pirellulales bacterium]